MWGMIAKNSLSLIYSQNLKNERWDFFVANKVVVLDFIWLSPRLSCLKFGKLRSLQFLVCELSLILLLLCIISVDLPGIYCLFHLYYLLHCFFHVIDYCKFCKFFMMGNDAKYLHLTKVTHSRAKPIQNFVENWFTLKPPEFYSKRIEQLPEQWQQVITNKGVNI